jgi:hypothetical protein
VYVDANTFTRSLGVINLQAGTPVSQTYITDQTINVLIDTLQIAGLSSSSTSLVRWWAPTVSTYSTLSLSVGTYTGGGTAQKLDTVSGQRFFLGYFGCAAGSAVGGDVSDVQNATSAGTFVSSSSSAFYTMVSALPLLCSYTSRPISTTSVSALTVSAGSTLWLPPISTVTSPFSWSGVLAATRNLTISGTTLSLAITASTFGACQHGGPKSDLSRAERTDDFEEDNDGPFYFFVFCFF